MNIFPTTPRLTKADAHRLVPHLGNVRTTLAPWLKTNPSTDDLKRAVLLEIRGAKIKHAPLQSINRGVLKTLLKTIQRNELGEIDTAIMEELKS